MEFLGQYASTLEFSIAFALFAIATYAALRGGILSLAGTPMAAVTGFVSLALVEDHNVPIELVLAAGVVVGLLSGLLISIPLARLESHWVALATIALVLMARVVVLNLDSVTGGVDGAPITRMVEPWHLFTALGAVMWVMARHRRSRLGLAAEAVRSHPDVAASLAIDVYGTRRSLWMLSGAIAGLAGVVYASLVQFLSPDTFYVNIAFVMLAAVVLGGNRHWFGGIVGAFVFTILPEVLRRFLTQGETIVNGVLLIVIMIYLPRGLVDPTRKVRRELKNQATNVHSEAESSADGEHDGESDLWSLNLTGRTAPEVDPAEERPAALSVEGVRKTYGGLVAISDLTFEVPEGSVFGIVGPNGAGKSTLLSVMSGGDESDRGKIRILGQDMTGWKQTDIAREGVARTYQTVQLFEDLTVLENIMVGFDRERGTNFWDPVFMTPRDRRERADLAERARALMDLVGVIGQPEQYAATLSYANQRRVEIARALAMEPSVLLLDEPTAGMHKLGSQAIGELMLRLTDRGLTVVVIEHNLELVLNYCEQAIVMDFGKLLAQGTPAACLSDPTVIEAYFGRKADAARIESLVKLRQHTGGQ
ncbi:branched-chain amino acid ABC transporter ATP-binding protein/permease [Candidatus Spongiisocius sp.]|uniref:branched-chain amino acid ABC transporter ATP-binding protein/permease n=1 Tax=Candidatus Spongiisocius sp. TaxID=3101273 RepID=UPI003B58B4E9